MKDVTLHAFNWKYTEITSALDDISDSGFGAVLIPPILYSEVSVADWWKRYQPLDYRILLSHLGNKAELETLLSEAHNRGIRIYADIVLNHMANRSTSDYCFPGDLELAAYAANPTYYNDNKIYGDLSVGLFSNWDFHEHVNISDWNSRYDVQYHQLNDLPDLTENRWVLEQQRELFYVLKQIGFDGFRIDAVKHMTERQLDNVADQRFLQDTFLFGEVLTTKDEEVDNFLKPYLTETHIAAYDFPLHAQMRSAFGYGGSLRLLVDPFAYGKALHWARAVTFTMNHDISLNDTFRGMMLDPQDEHLANVYILCRDGGVPLVFSDHNESAAKYSSDKDRWAGCYKRSDIRAMIEFHNATAGLPMCMLYEDDQFFVFARGEKGIVAINKSNEWAHADIWLYGLKNPGTYKELLHGYTMNLNGQDRLNLAIEPRSAQIWLA